jgi:hypothetical protein
LFTAPGEPAAPRRGGAQRVESRHGRQPKRADAICAYSPVVLPRFGVGAVLPLPPAAAASAAQEEGEKRQNSYFPPGPAVRLRLVHAGTCPPGTAALLICRAPVARYALAGPFAQFSPVHSWRFVERGSGRQRRRARACYLGMQCFHPGSDRIRLFTVSGPEIGTRSLKSRENLRSSKTDEIGLTRGCLEAGRRDGSPAPPPRGGG